MTDREANTSGRSVYNGGNRSMSRRRVLKTGAAAGLGPLNWLAFRDSVAASTADITGEWEVRGCDDGQLILEDGTITGEFWRDDSCRLVASNPAEGTDSWEMSFTIEPHGGIYTNPAGWSCQARAEVWLADDEAVPTDGAPPNSIRYMIARNLRSDEDGWHHGAIVYDQNGEPHRDLHFTADRDDPTELEFYEEDVEWTVEIKRDGTQFEISLSVGNEMRMTSTAMIDDVGVEQPDVIVGVVYAPPAACTDTAYEATISDLAIGPLGLTIDPVTEVVLAGVEREYDLVITNPTEEPLTGISLEVDSPADLPTVTVSDVPESLDPDEEAIATLTLDVPRDRTSPIPVEFRADTTEMGSTTSDVTFEVQDPVEVHMVSAGSADRAFVDNAAKFTFEVVANDVAPVEDVELIPRFDQVPEEWTVHQPDLNPDAYRHSVGRWIGGSSPDAGDDEFLNVWSASELAPSMVEQPSIELTVPDDLSLGEHTLPVEVYASTGDDGTPELVDSTEYQFDVDTQYTFLSVEAPDKPIVDQDRTTIDVTISVLREEVEGPEFAFETFPDEFEVVDGEASDDGFLSFSDQDVEWGGTFSEGDTLEAEFVVDLPGGEGAGGTYAVGGEVTASVPELGGEQRSRSARDVVTISDLVGQLIEKEGLAADIDDFARFIDDHQRVQPQLDAIGTAVDDGSLGAEDASAGVERMWQGERVVERSLELTAGKQPRQVGDRAYELIRPFAEDIADLVIHVAMLPASMAFRAGRLAGVAGARVLRESGQQGLKTIRRTADEMVRIRRVRARRQQRQVENPLEPLNEFFKEVTQEWVEGRIGIDEVRARLSEPLVSRIETHMRESYQLSADAQLEELHDALSTDDLSGGPPGTAQGASGAFWTGTQGIQWRARRGHQLTNEFNEGLTSTLGDMRETLAEAEASLDSGFRTFVKLSQEILDLFLTFLTGGLASAMIGRNALVTIDDAREEGIDGIAAGQDVGDSV